MRRPLALHHDPRVQPGILILPPLRSSGVVLVLCGERESPVVVHRGHWIESLLSKQVRAQLLGLGGVCHPVRCQGGHVEVREPQAHGDEVVARPVEIGHVVYDGEGMGMGEGRGRRLWGCAAGEGEGVLVDVGRVAEVGFRGGGVGVALVDDLGVVCGEGSELGHPGDDGGLLAHLDGGAEVDVGGGAHDAAGAGRLCAPGWGECG